MGKKQGDGSHWFTYLFTYIYPQKRIHPIYFGLKTEVSPRGGRTKRENQAQSDINQINQTNKTSIR